MNRSSLWVIVAAAGTAAMLGGGCKGEKRGEQSAAGSSAAASAPASATTPAPTESQPPKSSQAAAAPTSEFSAAEDYDTKPITRVDLASGLVIEDLKVGTGPAALPPDIATFHYRGKIAGDREFDCTLTGEGGPKPEVQPLNKLFKGLTDGMIGMQAGGRRRITIPPFLAPGIVGMKGIDGNVLIPSNATLIYVVDVVEIRPQPITAKPTPAPPAPPATPSGKP